MIEKVKAFITEENLITINDKILVAVSGGRDSIALLIILKQLGYNIEVAHCNYQLRAEESDEDEAFVANICKDINVPFHNKKFDTANDAKNEGVSIQMKARDLRYDWFKALDEKYSYNKIAVAHHLDDQLETMLINLTRGTGLKGLRGMKAKRDKIVRPFLCVERDEINEFLFSQHIPFREDSSNGEGKYFRNKIRHQVIPVLKEINPSLFKAINNTGKRLRNVEVNWDLQYEKWTKSLKNENGVLTIPYSEFNAENLSFIQQLLRAKGFSYPDIDNIIKVDTIGKGKTFFGKNDWIAISANGAYEVYMQKPEENQLYYLDKKLPIPLTIEAVQMPVDIKPEGNLAYINADKVQGKLHLRKWRQGDWFMPFGMRGKQKISDYFTNNKFSLKEKENTWLLCDAEKVVWIVGHRSDNRYRVDESTRNVFIISC